MALNPPVRKVNFTCLASLRSLEGTYRPDLYTKNILLQGRFVFHKTETNTLTKGIRKSGIMIDHSKLASHNGVIDFQAFRNAAYFPEGIEDPRKIPRETQRQLQGTYFTQEPLSSLAQSENIIANDWSYDLSYRETVAPYQAVLAPTILPDIVFLSSFDLGRKGVFQFVSVKNGKKGPICYL